MDDLERTVLSAALRVRPATVTELVRLVELPRDRVIDLLERHSDLMAHDGERIHYVRPDRRASARLRELAERRERQLAEELAELRALSDELPRLVTDWFSGVDEHAIGAEVAHGSDSGNDLWRDQLRHGAPRFARAVLPDLSHFLVPDEDTDRFFAMMSSRERSGRLIIGVDDARLPEIAQQLPRFAEAGVEVRMHPRPPSWFWLHDDRTAAIPLTWGDAWPTSVVALHSQPVIGVLAELFARLWNEAVPADTTGAEWAALLRLMRTGLTLDAASRTLGITPRTGRRRIAAAMEHYGAETLFGLGAAWAAASGWLDDVSSS